MEVEQTRSRFREITTKAAATIAVVAGIAVASACAIKAGGGSEIPEPTVSTYLPTYASDADLTEFAAKGDMLKDFNAYDIASATPTASGDVEVPDMSPAYINTVHTIQTANPHAEFRLSVGGWSINGSHEAMENNLDAVFADPDRFVRSLINARNVTARMLDINKNKLGFTLDLEYPDAHEKQAMTTIVKELDKQQPDATITVAVPARNHQEGFDLKEIAKHAGTIEVMTYDYTTNSSPDQNKAGDIAPVNEVVDDIGKAVQAVGDPSKVAVGIPAYGYLYHGAQQMGDVFTPPKSEAESQVLLKDIPPASIDAKGYAVVNGAVTSVVTPSMAAQIMEQVRAKFRVYKSFVWSAAGVTPELVKALTSKR